VASGVVASGVATAWRRVEGGEEDWGFPLGLTRGQADKAMGGAGLGCLEQDAWWGPFVGERINAGECEVQL